jgi:hypothetical protein
MGWANVWAARGQWHLARDTNHLYLPEGLWSACGSVEHDEIQGEWNDLKPMCLECKDKQDNGHWQD